MPTQMDLVPLPVRPENKPDPADYVLIMNHMESTSVNPDKIRQWTQSDPVMSQVYECVLDGWPYECPDKDLAPYFTLRDELNVHDGHPGISRMKSLARSYVWWPKIDRDLETEAKQRRSCQSTQQAPPVAPFHPREFPSKHGLDYTLTMQDLLWEVTVKPLNFANFARALNSRNFNPRKKGL